MVIEGSETLNAIGSSCKNGIKGGAKSTITINEGTINIIATKNGLVADGNVIINGGIIDISCGNDGIKSEPDLDDTESDGKITINNGTIIIDAEGDGVQATSNITINNGNITISAEGDGIQSAGDITISNGTFNITTLTGYKDSNFDGDSMSCKGIKASSDDEEANNTITISAGYFTFNTADDAIHSDAHVVITGGTFDIYTGDDAVHSDTTLVLGTSGGYERDPEFVINSSYEGLESGTVYIYSGKYYVIASDDGINSAGGSSNVFEPDEGDHFEPDEGEHFKPGEGDHFKPGEGDHFKPDDKNPETDNSNYNIYIYGGKIYINCDGDGIDSNGGLYCYGGDIVVLSQFFDGFYSGSHFDKDKDKDKDKEIIEDDLNYNSPFDADGDWVINGATLFGAGENTKDQWPSSDSQKYTVSSKIFYSHGEIINTEYNNSVIRSEKLGKDVNYIIYSSPNVNENVNFSTADSLITSKSNSWNQSWNDGVVETAATTTSTGVMLYTSSDNTEERKTIPMLEDGEIEVTVENETSGKATVTIDDACSTTDFSIDTSRSSLTVECPSACVVLVTADDGTSYTRLSAVATDQANKYKFDFGLDEDFKVIVALKGDIDYNGVINSRDARTLRNTVRLGLMNSLSALDKITYNIDGNNAINSRDVRALRKEVSSPKGLSW